MLKIVIEEVHNGYIIEKMKDSSSSLLERKLVAEDSDTLIFELCDLMDISLIELAKEIYRIHGEE